MRIAATVLLVFALSFTLAAQTDNPMPTPTPVPVVAAAPPLTAPPLTNIYGAGVSYNAGASPAIAGSALYARLVAGTGTYAFTQVDALPASIKPFTVTTNVSVGVAQKLATIAGIPIYVPASAGVSFNGTNAGWAWSGGGMAVVKVKGALVMPNVRFMKSSVSGGAGYGVIAGCLFGWGN